MGGYGSGRWGGHARRQRVEACRVVRVAAVVRGRAPPPGTAGVLRWAGAGREAAAVGYEVVAPPGCGPALRLRYRWAPAAAPAAGRDVVLMVPLEATAVPRGGVRWWGRCPLARGGVACLRRVGALYRPPGAAYFGCRRCHRLTYASRQDHDPRVTRLLKDPGLLAGLTRDPRRASVARLGLALKALTVQQERDAREAVHGASSRGRTPPPTEEETA